eukprot:CAMPEP_0114356018 /NCGR_PEP_ID=MMETSP0101-20121206/20658_1 /TAXON_ID=38822 ORGANISM="Pteridomonas danica, Strain PT" /NCGR_SAMPLE_ID=MMETSP0101 /ASSEMBLY_ACC=CAM_ASM_000211 /LENGTH=241 /DNA_ID=CAMNT_0001498263 /DNA_START=62 /DNA_END=784 /DNA_ORIENTATION=+
MVKVRRMLIGQKIPNNHGMSKVRLKAYRIALKEATELLLSLQNTEEFEDEDDDFDEEEDNENNEGNENNEDSFSENDMITNNNGKQLSKFSKKKYTTKKSKKRNDEDDGDPKSDPKSENNNTSSTHQNIIRLEPAPTDPSQLSYDVPTLLGYFDTDTEAALSYDSVAAAICKPVNFPDPSSNQIKAIKEDMHMVPSFLEIEKMQEKKFWNAEFMEGKRGSKRLVLRGPNEETSRTKVIKNW